MFTELAIKFHHIQMVGALLGGMALQYMLGAAKGFRVLLVIVASTIFLALFILSPLMEWANGKEVFGITLSLGRSAPLRVVVYALSSLMSVEIIAMVIVLLPSAIRRKITKSIGIGALPKGVE